MNNTLFFRAGAGVVIASEEEGELQEVNNKLAALRKAIELASMEQTSNIHHQTSNV